MKNIKGKRITLDIDPPYVKAKTQKALKLLKRYGFNKDVEVRISPSGKGRHVISWSEVGLPIHELMMLRRIAGDDSVSEDTRLYWKENGILKFSKISSLYDSFVKGNKIEVLTAKIREKHCKNINLRPIFTAPFGEIVWEQITDCWYRGMKEVYRVELNNGKSIEITKNHSLFGRLKQASVTNKIVPVSLMEIEENKESVVASIELEINDCCEFDIDDDFLTLCGLWLADGCYDRDTKIKISTGDDIKIIDWLKIYISKNPNFYGKISKASLSKSRNGDLTFSLKKTVEKMKELGFFGKSNTKKIPEFVFTLQNHKIEKLLKGYFSGDGCLSLSHGQPMVSAVSVSEQLMKDVKILLSKVGIASNFREGKTKGYSTNRCQTENKIFILLIEKRDSVEKFLDRINFIKKYGEEKYIIRESNRQQRQITLRKIRKITSIGLKNVYDIDIKPTESFVAEGILCHNSTRIYLDTKSYQHRSRMRQVIFTTKKVMKNG